MTPPGQTTGPSTASVPPAEAGFFAVPGARPCFCWLHRAAQPSTGVALVIVPPFGYEAVCAQRSLRHLAVAAAQAGIVAVRVEPEGTGNSPGSATDPDRLEAWLASIDAACELARGMASDRIVLAGVRLGATLASLAAQSRRDVAAVIAIAAVPRTRAWLREGHLLQMSLDLAPAPVPASADITDAAQEIVGFGLSASTRDALAAIDLGKIERAPAPAMLLLDRDDLPANDAWAAHLAALGVEVDHRQLPGYVEMVLDPHRAQIPRDLIDAAVRFSARCAAPGRKDRPIQAAEPESRLVKTHAGSTYREDVVALDEALFAMATRPPGTPRRAVILLNAGAVGQIGPNRLYVMLARRLAAAGDLVLRVDLSGIGDSSCRDGAQENVVYSPHAVADVGKAVEWVRRAGAREVAVAGLCSGAYHALRAALAGHAIDTVIAINPLTFHYAPGMPLDYAAFRVTADAMRYQKSIVSGSSWRKLLRGQVDLVRVSKVLMLRARDAVGRPVREILRFLRIPLKDDLGQELTTLAQRNVALRFIFAADDPGQRLLAEEGGSSVKKLAADGHLTVRIIRGADHTFTARWTHPLLLEAITEALER